MIRLNDIVEDIKSTFTGRKFFFDRAEVSAGIVLPKAWESFGLRLDDAPAYPDSWQSYSTEFPSVIALLNNSLLGTVLLADDKLELLYVFHDANGFYYYIGGLPVEGVATDKEMFEALPIKLQRFYREVHDGYTFFPARSMGPQSLSDISRVSDFIDEEDVSFADSWITVFSNGGGDFVAIDTVAEKASEGLIWWHENPTTPEYGVDIFEIMDAWMTVFLEGTRSREELIANFY